MDDVLIFLPRSSNFGTCKFAKYVGLLQHQETITASRAKSFCCSQSRLL